MGAAQAARLRPRGARNPPRPHLSQTRCHAAAAAAAAAATTTIGSPVPKPPLARETPRPRARPEPARLVLSADPRRRRQELLALGSHASLYAADADQAAVAALEGEIWQV